MPLYLSSELEPKTMSDFELHLDHCLVCHREIEQQKTYDILLRDSIRSQAPDVRYLRASVLDQITTRGSRSLFFNRRVYSIPIAAMLLAIFGTTIIYLATRSATVASVYADAVDDHYEEVVQRVPLANWRETFADINLLSEKRLGDREIMNKLGPTGYQLVRARVCELGGELYVHAEYKNERGEISIFLKRRSGELPGAAKEVVKGCPIHLESTRGFQVAGFQSEQFTVLIVSNLPPEENSRLARESATRLV